MGRRAAVGDGVSEDRLRGLVEADGGRDERVDAIRGGQSCRYFDRDFNTASARKCLPSRMNQIGILSPIFFIRMIHPNRNLRLILNPSAA
jgi:hypothetical protein